MHLFSSKNIKRNARRYYWAWIPAIFLILGYTCLYDRLFNSLNPDLVSYFAVARHYQEGNFPVAFNAYWSPLICWLMAPFPWLLSDAMGLFRWIQMFAGIILFFQLIFWLRLLVHSSFVRLCALMLMVVCIVHYALFIGSPDFLAVPCFFIFLRKALEKRNSVSHGIGLGACILLSFFSKSFILLFCFALLGLLGSYYLWKKHPLPLRSWGSALAVVVLGLGCWAMLLHSHYNKWTLGTSYAYNSVLEGGVESENKLSGIPYPTAAFAWEDPSYLPTKPNFFWSSQHDFELNLRRWKHNFILSSYILRFFSYLWLGVLLFPLIGIFIPGARSRYCLLMWLVAFINWGGFLLVIMMERYLIIGHFALMLSVLGFYNEIYERSILKGNFLSTIFPHSTRKHFQLTGAVVLCLAFVKNPIEENWHEQLKYKQLTSDLSAVENLRTSQVLAGKKVVISIDEFHLSNLTTLACYYSKGYYLGECNTALPRSKQQSYLSEGGVELILLRNTDLREEAAWIRSLPVYYRDSTHGIVLYQYQ
ncbi:MAG: hypothetical protein MUF42_15460 [Cytophagaceae bacterium]|jgi:hypothetical protein|nr:hypothetical protein [Cytophagaceae bacterium]